MAVANWIGRRGQEWVMSGDTHDGELIRASLDVPERFGAIFDRHYRVIDG